MQLRSYLIALTLPLTACPPPGPGTTDSGTPDPVAPAVTVSADLASGPAPLGVYFSVQVIFDTGTTAETYSWDFGDGESANERYPHHIFSAQGNFTVTCVVTDTNGLSGSDEVTITVESALERHYVGSATCSGCHSAKHATWLESGHANSIKAIAGTAPGYPHSTVSSSPAGYTWADLTYVIGGHGWKARFLDSSGELIAGTGSQLNVASQTLATPHDSTAAGPQSCGQCHTTGWQDAADNGGAHQDDLSGIEGTWVEAAVGCEACHGPGSLHAAGPSPANIEHDLSYDLCARCHQRGTGDHVYLSDGLLASQQQFNAFSRSAHWETHALACFNCHDPHASVVHDETAAGQGIEHGCSFCHQPASYGPPENHEGTICEDCHMPPAALSAERSGDGLHATGDLHPHIWTIDGTGATLTEAVTESGGESWLTPDGDDRVHLNLAWSCLGCHDSTTAPEFADQAAAAAQMGEMHPGEGGE